MTTHTAPTTFDIPAYVAAIEGRDAEGQIAAFTADAELTLIDHEHPPSNPLVLRGADALRAHFTDICGRDMTHQVTTATSADDRLTVEVNCLYADGTRVACLSVAGLADGRISWQRGLQAWDR
ncbi:MAG: nuclear transport factor 2 family protein [Solirubrobacteraceae bacterium]